MVRVVIAGKVDENALRVNLRRVEIPAGQSDQPKNDGRLNQRFEHGSHRIAVASIAHEMSVK